MEQKIIQILSEVSGVPEAEIKPDSRLTDELGLTSFDLADIVVAIEDEYGLSIADELLPQLVTVGDIIKAASEVLGNEKG